MCLKFLYDKPTIFFYTILLSALIKEHKKTGVKTPVITH